MSSPTLPASQNIQQITAEYDQTFLHSDRNRGGTTGALTGSTESSDGFRNRYMQSAAPGDTYGNGIVGYGVGGDSLSSTRTHEQERYEDLLHSGQDNATMEGAIVGRSEEREHEEKHKVNIIQKVKDVFHSPKHGSG